MLDLLAEAAAWTAALGQPNWPARFPRRPIEAGARSGELFLVEVAGELVGTVTLQWSDPVIWGDQGDDASAGYVHRLIVRRDRAGAGLGARVLDWVDTQVQARGLSQVRLDVVSSNAPLRRYYERERFAHVRDAAGHWTDRAGTRHEWRTSLYRRPRAAPGVSL